MNRETIELMSVMADMQEVMQELAEIMQTQQKQLNNLHSQMLYLWKEFSSDEPIQDAKNKLT